MEAELVLMSLLWHAVEGGEPGRNLLVHQQSSFTNTPESSASAGTQKQLSPNIHELWNHRAGSGKV